MGKVDGNYTHVSINDALVRKNKIMGDNFIQRTPLNPSEKIKVGIKDKIGNFVINKKEKIKSPIIKRPELVRTTSCYIRLNDEATTAIKSYFDAANKLGKQDTYANAVRVVEAANKVNELLKPKVKEIRKNSQMDNFAPAVEMSEQCLRRIRKGESVGYRDLLGLDEEIKIPKLNSELKQEIKELTLSISDTKHFEKKAVEFLNKNREIIQHWNEQALSTARVDIISAKKMRENVNNNCYSTEVIYGVVRSVEDVVKTSRVELSKEIDRDRSRGGRSY